MANRTKCPHCAGRGSLQLEKHVVRCHSCYGTGSCFVCGECGMATDHHGLLRGEFQPLCVGGCPVQGCRPPTIEEQVAVLVSELERMLREAQPSTIDLQAFGRVSGLEDALALAKGVRRHG